MVNWTQTPKVSLARVAFSGNYWDLIDRPKIGDGTLEIYQGETLKGRFTANQTTDTRIDLSTGTTSIDWGQIGGDIDDQRDLAEILYGKVDSSDLGSGTLSILANRNKLLGDFSANSQLDLDVDLSELYLAGEGISILTDYDSHHDNKISVVIGQGTGLSFSRSGELEIDKVPVGHGGTGADTANGAEYNLFGTKASVGIGQIEDGSKIMFFTEHPSLTDGTINGYGTPVGLWGYDKNKMHLERLLPETTGGGSITVHSAVPSEYTPVRYVTGSMSESVLDTGIPTVDSGLEIKVRWYQNGFPNTNNPLVVGVINGYGVGLSGGSRNNTISAMCNGTVVESNISRAAGNTYEATMSLKSTVERGTITLTVYDITNGNYDTVSEEYLENVSGDLQDSGTMFLLGCEGVGYNTAGAAHIESVSIKQSGDLVLDYIPVMSSSNAYDTYGFWDTVTGTFCYERRVSLLTGGGQAENNRSVVYYDDSHKADKTVPSASGNIATLDSTGNLLDSGCQISELGNIKPNWEAASGSDAEILNKPNIKRQGSSSNQASAIVEGDLDNNIAYGKFSHAEGSSTLTLSEGGHSEGKGTVTESTFKISRKSGAIYVSDIDPTSEISEYSVIEYRDVAKYVSKIEFVDNEWQITLSTAFSSPQPSNSTVNIRRGVSIGTGSHVEGQNCSVIRAYGHAEGLGCKAIGNGAHAEGNSVKATGDYSHSEGRDTSAIGNYSHSEGRYSESAGNYAHSEGYDTSAIGVQSHAEGRRTMARGLSSHAEGYCADTNSTFTVSAAAGATTYTTNAAHNLVKRQRVAYNGIETYVSTVNSSTSFTVYETLNPDAALQGATIEVLSNHANSQGSHVEGSAVVAAHLYAHAEGEGTVAYNRAEHAEGRWNYSQDYGTTWGNPNNFLHTIGFGSGADDRRNAVSVMQDGNVFINNVGGYDGTLNPGNSSKKSLQTVLSELEESDAYTVRCLVGTSGLIQNTLCAFDRNGSLHSIVTYDKDDNLTPSRSIEFVGNVYYYDGQDIAAGTDAYDLTLYKTFRHTDARKMLFGQTDAENKDQMGRITSTTYDGPSEMYISVSFGDCGWFLNPEIPSGRVNEEILFSRSNLGNVEDGAYIRLGCHNATDSTDEDWWSIQLESENGAYYYDSSLQYVKEYVNHQLGNIESLLSAI